MRVDNRIPSEPYMELNGVTVYTEGVYRHGKSPEITKGTIGEKLMDREYNGLGCCEMSKSIDFRVFKDHNWVGIAYVKDDIGQIQGFKFMYKGPEKLKDTYEKGDYFRAEVLGFEYDLVFERDFWYDLDEKTSEYGLEFRILW